MEPKPLELTVFRSNAGLYQHEAYWLNVDEVYEWFTDPKRLTDAELAAEYWRALGDCELVNSGYGLEAWSDDMTEANHRGEVIERFATTPSYDEVPE